MKGFRMLVTVLLAASTAGCYHAIIDTGRTPSGQTIEKPWAHSFIAGLVPPEVIETASRCPNGVAKVETQHSFLNMVAAIFSSGIYTPMTITVQCAAGGSPDAAAAGAPARSGGDGAEAILEAARESARTGNPVFVDLR